MPRGPKAEDLTGKICGIWKVIERDTNPTSKSHETFWKCECQRCGNIASVRKTDLKKEPTSCNNCKNQVYATMKPSYKIGDRYGLLTIIDKSNKDKGHHTYVTCQCDCGNIIEVRLEHLRGQCHSKTISCGCSTISSGELKIKQLLEESKVSFAQQFRLSDFSIYAPFDFCVFTPMGEIDRLIEFDGEQHFRPIDFFGGEEKFQKQKQTDQRKDAYCQEHGIKLVRILYTKLDTLTAEDLLS